MDDETDERECSLLNPDKTLPKTKNPDKALPMPKTLKGLAEATKGSESSLLDEDQWLKKGMDEDGSFRGRYLEWNDVIFKPPTNLGAVNISPSRLQNRSH